MSDIKLGEVNPYIRFAAQMELKKRDGVSMSYDSRLIYLRHGAFEMEYCERRLSAVQGDILLWQGGVPYRFTAPEPVDIIILNFDFSQNYSYITELLPIEDEHSFDSSRLHTRESFEDCEVLDTLVHIRGAQALGDELSALLAILSERRLYYAESASAKLKSIITTIARLASGDDENDGTVERVIAYIRENYRRPITNREIADSVNYHEYYVNRLIRRRTGMTLHRYLLNFRIESAKRLLTTTALPLAAIAEECGFTSDAYFVSAFRHETGGTPSEFRRRSGLI